jgi:membrane protein DedA with SNARE-associated domain
MATPLVLGSGHVKTLRFLSLNIVSAFTWAVIVTIAGYLFGQVLQTMMGDIKRYELRVMLAIVALGILMALIHLYRRDRKKRRAKKNAVPRV